MVLHTYRLTSIALADEPGEELPAVLPIFGFGNHIDWGATGNESWSEIPFEMAEDEVQYTQADENRLIIKAPRSPLKTAVIKNADALDRIDFTAYEIGAKVLQIATNKVELEDGGITTGLVHTARRSAILEYGGIGFLYLPSVEISVKVPEGGIWTIADQMVTFELFGTDDIPSGYIWYELDES